MKPKTVVLDIETYSEADLTKVGTYNYAMHYSTHVIAIGLYVDGKYKWAKMDPRNIYSDEEMLRSFDEVRTLLEDPNTKIVCHNSKFEYALLKYCLRWGVTPKQFICTMTMGALRRGPLALKTAASFFGLGLAKEDRKYMRMFCLPSETELFAEADCKAFLNYLKQDVILCAALYKKFGEPSKEELELQKQALILNEVGVPVDVEFFSKVEEINNTFIDNINKKVEEITDGKIKKASQKTTILNWVNQRSDIELTSMGAITVRKFLDYRSHSDKVGDILALYLASNHASPKKASKVKATACKDGRVRFCFTAGGAIKTGRWTSQGVQFQNFPRLNHKIADKVYADVNNLTTKDFINKYKGDTLKVLSECLRYGIRAGKGKKLVVIDYAQIELRVLLYIAKELDKLKKLAEGKDVYKEFASQIYDIPEIHLTKESPERSIAKNVVLGAGYGSGPTTIQRQITDSGQKVSIVEAAELKQKYKKAFPKVVELWNRVKKSVKPGNYELTLPSGRVLKYEGLRPKEKEIKFLDVDKSRAKGRAVWTTKRFTGYEDRNGREIGYPLIVGNLCQSTALDIFNYNFVKVSEKFTPVMVVHDECVLEVDDDVLKDAIIREFSHVPSWFPDFPLDIGAGEDVKYTK